MTPAEKLTTGKKSPSVLKFSNMPWTGCPLILKDMLGAPRSRQQLTTSSEVRMCWFMDATARGIRPDRDTRTNCYVKYDLVSCAGTNHTSTSLSHTHTYCWIHTFAHSDTDSGQGDRPCRALVLSRHNLAVTQGYRSSSNALVTPDTGLSHPPDQRWSPSKPYE